MDVHDLDCRRCVVLGNRPVGQMIQRGPNRIGLYEESELCNSCFTELKQALKEAELTAKWG